MVELSAFRGVRYDAKVVGDVSKVLAPPYDVIGDAEQDALYARHPHNIIRIDLNKPEDSDHMLARYERARGFLETWRSDGVLVQDARPAIYVLAQTFTGPDGVERTRTGFFSRAKLVTFDEKIILPHERTLRGPKVDRLNLYRSTKMNLSPIFGAYEDPDRAIGGLLSAAIAGRAPAVDVTFGGVTERMWVVDDAATVAELSRRFAAKKLYIADGHHRYETGLAYRDERRAEHGTIDPSKGYEHILMFSSAVEDPGMVIFPTHRIVHGVSGFDGAKLLAALEPYFTIEQAPSDPKAARAKLASHQATNAFVLALRGGAKHLLVGRADAPWDGVAALPKTPSLSRLDVSILHAVILESILGISREAQATQANLRYSKDFAEAFGVSDRDASVDAVFLMNPTEIDEVTAVADAGEVMPQKSTFFYPKIPTGLVLCELS